MPFIDPRGPQRALADQPLSIGRRRYAVQTRTVGTIELPSATLYVGDVFTGASQHVPFSKRAASPKATVLISYVLNGPQRHILAGWLCFAPGQPVSWSEVDAGFGIDTGSAAIYDSSLHSRIQDDRNTFEARSNRIFAGIGEPVTHDGRRLGAYFRTNGDGRFGVRWGSAADGTVTHLLLDLGHFAALGKFVEPRASAKPEPALTVQQQLGRDFEDAMHAEIYRLSQLEGTPDEVPNPKLAVVEHLQQRWDASLAALPVEQRAGLFETATLCTTGAQVAPAAMRALARAMVPELAR